MGLVCVHTCVRACVHVCTPLWCLESVWSKGLREDQTSGLSSSCAALLGLCPARSSGVGVSAHASCAMISVWCCCK